jgi:putative transposase
MMQTNAAGDLVSAAWHALPRRFAAVTLDECVVMPNHLHGIIILGLDDAVLPGLAPLGEIVRTFKATTTWQIRRAANPTFGWQRNYYEHVIRDDEALARIRQYIHDNPGQWAADPENPEAAVAVRG